MHECEYDWIAYAVIAACSLIDTYIAPTLLVIYVDVAISVMKSVAIDVCTLFWLRQRNYTSEKRCTQHQCNQTECVVSFTCFYFMSARTRMGFVQALNTY